MKGSFGFLPRLHSLSSFLQHCIEVKEEETWIFTKQNTFYVARAGGCLSFASTTRSGSSHPRRVDSGWSGGSVFLSGPSCRRQRWGTSAFTPRSDVNRNVLLMILEAGRPRSGHHDGSTSVDTTAMFKHRHTKPQTALPTHPPELRQGSGPVSGLFPNHFAWSRLLPPETPPGLQLWP